LPPVDGWLRQKIRNRRQYHPGPTLEQLALESFRSDSAELTTVLLEWKTWLARQQSPAPAGEHSHPYAAGAGATALPGNYLDVGLANFTRDDSGRLSYFDDEWQTETPLDATLVMLRALGFQTRQYHPADPALAEFWAFGGGSTPTGLRITPENAMQCPAVQACISLLSNTVATLPLDMFERVAEGGSG
jgi:hypothetical protein